MLSAGMTRCVTEDAVATNIDGKLYCGVLQKKENQLGLTTFRARKSEICRNLTAVVDARVNHNIRVISAGVFFVSTSVKLLILVVFNQV